MVAEQAMEDLTAKMAKVEADMQELCEKLERKEAKLESVEKKLSRLEEIKDDFGSKLEAKLIKMDTQAEQNFGIQENKIKDINNSILIDITLRINNLEFFTKVKSNY